MSDSPRKGGMSPNAFAGRQRLDQIDLAAFRTPETTPEQLILLTTISDAVSSYLFFGLGRNGTCAEEFAYACRYLFEIRSTNPDSYQDGRIISQYKTLDDGRRMLQKIYLTDTQIRQYTFDAHYEDSGMSRLLPMDRFLSRLRKERKEILTKNWDQVQRYLAHLRERDYMRMCNREQLTLNIEPSTQEQMLESLVYPKSPREIANMVYHAAHCRPRRGMRRTPDPTSTRAKVLAFGVATD